MIRSFASKQLKDLWVHKRSRIYARFHKCIFTRLFVLDSARQPHEMGVTGFDFHALKS